MKQAYEAPVSQLVYISTADIITSSVDTEEDDFGTSII